MYSTCIFCHASLGTNEAIEHFPVGRRLAFDAAKGRLWVVCRSCERWNLTPLDERWEAIEECEQSFADAKLRVSTDHVGLARLREGTTLVRIGAPKRPEMAAWRYGDQFGRRRRRHLVTGAAVAAAAGGLVIAGPVMGLIGAGAVNLINVGNILNTYRTVVRLNVNGQQIGLTKHSLNYVELRPSRTGGFELEVPRGFPWDHKMRLWAAGGVKAAMQQGSVTLTGNDALRAARVLLPRVNASGGAPGVVSDALDLLSADPEPERMFSRMAALESRSASPWWVVPGAGYTWSNLRYRLSGLTAAQRLAMEMALHEDDERLALDGELSALEERWKEAEEIAAISDDLFLPSGVAERLRAMKQRS
jgi:hypothetical protein